jgi:hypothetical protein
MLSPYTFCGSFTRLPVMVAVRPLLLALVPFYELTF